MELARSLVQDQGRGAVAIGQDVSRLFQNCLCSSRHREFGVSDVSESSLADEKPSPIISVRLGTIGTSGLGIFSAALNVDVALPRGLARLPRIDYWNNIIRTAKNMPILLYDNEQLVWLVPMLSVISHMARAWVATQALHVQLPYAQPDWDGSPAAWNNS